MQSTQTPCLRPVASEGHQFARYCSNISPPAQTWLPRKSAGHNVVISWVTVSLLSLHSRPIKPPYQMQQPLSKPPYKASQTQLPLLLSEFRQSTPGNVWPRSVSGGYATYVDWFRPLYAFIVCSGSELQLGWWGMLLLVPVNLFATLPVIIYCV